MTLRTSRIAALRPEHRVAPHELLFSTADRRGLITDGNSVFERICGHHTDESVGSPHHHVRHPQMPAGVFRLMWDRLLSGRPVAAYVTNRARDGATYRVFATVTPLGEDFLSVRVAPAGPLATAAVSVYEQVVRHERALAADHSMSGPAVTAAGAGEIERHLADLGFADYDDFMSAALTGEVAARGRPLATVFARAQARGHLAEILQGAEHLYDQLEGTLDRLDGYQQLAARLGPATDAVLGHALSLQRAVEAARTASTGVAVQSPVLLNVARVMRQPMASAVQALERLANDLTALRRDVGGLGFRIGLACLHTEMVGALAAEVVDGAAPASSLAEVPRLCDAVDDGVAAMAEAVDEANESLKTLAGRIGDAVALMQDFRTFLGQWRIMVMRRRQGAAVAEHLGPIDIQLDAATDQLAYLESLAAQCHGSVSPVDRAVLEPHLRRIRAGAGYSPASPAVSSLSRAAALDIALARARARASAPVPIWR